MIFWADGFTVEDVSVEEAEAARLEVVWKQRQLKEAEAARLGMPAGAVSSGRNLEAERAELASLKSQQLEAQRQMQARSRPHARTPATHARGPASCRAPTSSGSRGRSDPRVAGRKSG